MKILHKIGFTALAAAAVFALASCNKDDEYDVTIVENELAGVDKSYYYTASGTYTVSSYNGGSTLTTTTYTAKDTYGFATVEIKKGANSNYTTYNIKYVPSTSGTSTTANTYNIPSQTIRKIGSEYYIEGIDDAVTPFSSGTPGDKTFTVNYTYDDEDNGKYAANDYGTRYVYNITFTLPE